MNDSEMFERLQRIDPLQDGVRITPAHSAPALTLMESIMTNESPHAPRRSHRRWYVTVGAAAAAVAAAVVLPGIGGSSMALAWTPTPRAATEADADAAREACVVPDADSRSDTAAPAAPAPITLGSLVALDLRGDGGLAVFTGGEGLVMCMLRVVDGTPEYAGMTSTGTPTPSPDTLAVEGGMTTGLDTTTAVSMLTGQAGSAARVEIEVSGLDPITATLVDGRFAAWWPESASSASSSLEGSITIRSFAADGTEIAEVDWTGARDTTDPQRPATP